MGVRHSSGRSGRILTGSTILSVGEDPMSQSLPDLEAQHSNILGQLSTLGDLGSGSICAAARRCGKPSCHCAKPKDPGHDPQVRFTDFDYLCRRNRDRR